MWQPCITDHKHDEVVFEPANDTILTIIVWGAILQDIYSFEGPLRHHRLKKTNVSSSLWKQAGETGSGVATVGH